MTSNLRSYYCSLKFDYLSVNLERRSLSSCCSATPFTVKIDDLKLNGLLNNATIQKEREEMLGNRRVQSCETYCWIPEDNNQNSRRSFNKKHIKIYNKSKIDNLDILNIIVGSRCNLTCVYCDKRYSNTWASDIYSNGNYQIDHDTDRYTFTNQDYIIYKSSQSELMNSTLRNLLETEIQNISDKVNGIQISGGESLLYMETIEKILENVPSRVKVMIFTGAGLPTTKFQTIIERLSKFQNVEITISAETTNKFYEFSRYGVNNSYKNFLTNLNILKNNVEYNFSSTLSNLTIFDFYNFVDKFGYEKIKYKNLCMDPPFLNVNVLDEQSKKNLLNLYNHSNFDILTNNIQISDEVSAKDKNNLSVYLKEFAHRRNLDLNIFPKSFLDWLYVV